MMNETTSKVKASGIMLFADELMYVTDMTDESVGKIFKTLVTYYMTDEIPNVEFNLAEKMLFDHFVKGMETSFIKYQETCNNRRIAGKKAAESRWKKVKLSEATSADDFKLNNEELSELKQLGMLDDENAAKTDAKKTAETSAPEPQQKRKSSDLSPVYGKTENNIVTETKESAAKKIPSDDNSARASGEANKYTKDRNISPEKIERDRNEYDKITRNFLQDI